MVKKERFGQMPDGREISLYTLENRKGISASFTDLGAVWVRMNVPDREGNLADVLLGYDDAAGYLNNGPHFGSVIGRSANRTAMGRFILNGTEYRLAQNNGENNLHSGPDYYDRRLWSVEAGENFVTFFLESPDGDQGFPGKLALSVSYTLTEEDCVEIAYQAVSDQDTIFAPTNHAYFNLKGHDGGSVLDHRIGILADFFTPNGPSSVPTGEVLRVDKTPMDFRKEKRIGEEISADDQQLKQAGGYDHNWCLGHSYGDYALAAWAWEEKSGREMRVYTDMPGVQLYTANGLKATAGKNGAVYGRREAFCFETQFYPDAVNKPQFASPVLKAGSRFMSRTGYQFLVRK